MVWVILSLILSLFSYIQIFIFLGAKLYFWSLGWGILVIWNLYRFKEELKICQK